MNFFHSLSASLHTYILDKGGDIPFPLQLAQKKLGTWPLDKAPALLVARYESDTLVLRKRHIKLLLNHTYKRGTQSTDWALHVIEKTLLSSICCLSKLHDNTVYDCQAACKAQTCISKSETFHTFYSNEYGYPWVKRSLPYLLRLGLQCSQHHW